MPLYSEHISNMYYSGSPSYTGLPYNYGSSVSPLGTSYSASYLNSGGAYSNHSSLGGYSRAPLSSRWISSTGRNYSPVLRTITERDSASPVRINSPRRISITKRTYGTPAYTLRPININTADIDVSSNRYRHKPDPVPLISPKTSPKREEPSTSNENGPFMPRVDGKPETGIDSSPGTQNNTIKRGRTVVRLHTIKRRERDSPRKPNEDLSNENNENIFENDVDATDQAETQTVGVSENLSWRERLSEDLIYKGKKEKKSLGTKLVEKFKIRDDDREILVQGTTKAEESAQSLPTTPMPNTNIGLIKPSDRRCSVELLAEQASLLDSLIRSENLSTASLDLSKVGIKDGLFQITMKIKSNDAENPLKTTKSDHSLHDSLKRDAKQFPKRRSLKKSSSGGSIRRLDSITEFPKGILNSDLPSIEESRHSIKNDSEKPKPKLKTKITTSVDVSPPKSPLKFKVENVTVEEIPRTPKKEITYSSAIYPLIETESNLDKEAEINTPQRNNKNRKSFKKKSKVSNDETISIESEDGNFWDKIGKRETVYLIKRKEILKDAREKHRRALFWYPEDDELHTQDDHEMAESNRLCNEANSNPQKIIQNKLTPTSKGQTQEIGSDLITEIITRKEIEKNEVISLDNSLDLKTDIKDFFKEKADLRFTETKSCDNIHSKITTLSKTNSFDSKTPTFDEKILSHSSENEKEDNKAVLNEKEDSVSEIKLLNKEISDLIQKPIEIPQKTHDQHKSEQDISDLLKQQKNTEKLVCEIKEISSSEDQKKIDNESIKSCDNIELESINNSNNIDLLHKNSEEEKSCKVLPVTEEIVYKNEAKVSPSEKTKFKSSGNVTLPKDPSKETLKRPIAIATNVQKVKEPVKQSENGETIPTTKPSQKQSMSHDFTPKACTSSTILLENEPDNKGTIDKEEVTEKKVLDVTITPVLENIPNENNQRNIEVFVQEEGLGEDKKAEKIPMIETKTLEATKPESQEVIKLPLVPSPRKQVKEEPAMRPLIATPRPLQKKVPQVIHSSSSSESSSEDSSDDEDEDADESDSSEDSTEFYECENNPDGRTSTGSNDSGFDSSAPTSPAGFVHIKKDCDVNCHRKCEKLTANLCGVNQRLLVEALASRPSFRKGGDSPGTSTSSAQGDATVILEQELEQSTAYGLFKKTGRFTPPARSIPRFRKYAIDDFHFIKVLGKGSFGKVLLTELRDTEYYYAVKCLKKDVVLEDDDVECTLIERKVLALGTNHPYLCHLFATFQTDSHLFFVMEYLNGGDLMFHIQQSGRFPETRARFYAAEIVSGLKFLHKRGIVYRDLKLDNILLDFDGHVRIADFGMCKLQIYLEKTADTFCGTPDYMAPEIIKGLKYNQAVDWWSFGVLLYEMLIGQSPFSGCDEDELFWSICNEMPSYPRFLSQEALTVLTRLLDKDARTRLGGVECMHGDIRDQEFFRPIHWDRLERRELDAPFKPRVRHPLDTQYFDRAFTGERPRLTAVEPHVLRSMDQEPFRGFSYTNPNATDR